MPVRLAFAAAALTALSAAPPAAAQSEDDQAAQVLAVLNAYRAERGLPPLRRSGALDALAVEHSTTMRERGRPSHDGFPARFARSGAYLCVENVAQGFRQPAQVVQGWRGVPTHHRNMLEPKVTYAGIAQVGRFVTWLACDGSGG
jgi:uncharacterized protein YkwD